jgi:hypothetical protein
MTQILERYDHVSSALNYLQSVTRLGRNNLLLADSYGHLAGFEIGYSSYGLFESREGFLVSTNHFLSDELRDCFVDTSPTHTRGNTFHRHEKVSQALKGAQGAIDVAFAKRLMAFHDGPLASICRHPVGEDELETISTSIFLPQKRRMIFGHGLSCQAHYDDIAI